VPKPRQLSLPTLQKPKPPPIPPVPMWARKLMPMLPLGWKVQAERISYCKPGAALGARTNRRAGAAAGGCDEPL
jgi:hypothetical protein